MTTIAGILIVCFTSPKQSGTSILFFNVPYNRLIRSFKEDEALNTNILDLSEISPIAQLKEFIYLLSIIEILRKCSIIF